MERRKLERIAHLKQLHKYYCYRARKAKSPRVHAAFVLKDLKTFVEGCTLEFGEKRYEQKTRLRALRASKQEMKHSYKGQA